MPTQYRAWQVELPLVVYHLPSERSFGASLRIVDAVVTDWTRAGQALRCFYSGPNYNILLKRILAVHGHDTRAVAAFASVSWLAFDDRLVVHSEPCVQLVEVLPPEVVDAADHHHELQSLTTRVTDLEAQVEALTCELGHSRDHIGDQRETITRLHGRLRDRSHNYNGGPWNNKNKKRRRDYN
jgi:hypothetical protein